MERRDTARLVDPPAAEARTEPAAVVARTTYDATDHEARRELTLGIIHEMNNALGGIAVLSEIYQTPAGDAEGLGEGLGLIHKSAVRLQTLVGHLKLLNGPTRSEPTYLNLTDLVRTQFEMFAPLLPKTLTVETAFPSEELAVHLDEILFRRVLLNLALNLRDDLARHVGTAKMLRVSIRHRAGVAELTLATGHGSPPELPALPEGAAARVADAQRILQETGGTVIAYTNGWYVLALPLAV